MRTDIFHTIIESFQSMLPFLVLLALFMIAIMYRLLIKTRKFSYTQDVFRHDIERQMYELSKQLAVTDERFRSINHLLLAAQGTSIKSSNEDDKHAFFSALGVNLDAPVQDDLIFILMPFNPDYDTTYAAIKGVCQDAGFRCMRGDEKPVNGEILPQILQEIVKARLVIADITGRNANVLYELGIAHALGKSVLLISQTSHDIPFDIGHMRVLTYQNPNQLITSLKNWLIGSFAQMGGKKKSINN